jgi:ribosomal protein L22
VADAKDTDQEKQPARKAGGSRAKKPPADAPAKPSGATKAKAAKDEPAAKKPARGKKEKKKPEAAAKPAAKPAAGRRREAPERPVVRARAKYVRSSARKARLVMDHVRGKSVGDARALLHHSPRGVARDLERLLASAVANAENNHDLIGDDLYVKEIYADEGPTLKRYRARAQGRAFRIRKRTSHLTVTLTPKE